MNKTDHTSPSRLSQAAHRGWGWLSQMNSLHLDAGNCAGRSTEKGAAAQARLETAGWRYTFIPVIFLSLKNAQPC